jgi:hypothetical protein
MILEVPGKAVFSVTITGCSNPSEAMDAASEFRDSSSKSFLG